MPSSSINIGELDKDCSGMNLISSPPPAFKTLNLQNGLKQSRQNIPEMESNTPTVEKTVLENSGECNDFKLTIPEKEVNLEVLAVKNMDDQTVNFEFEPHDLNKVEIDLNESNQINNGTDSDILIIGAPLLDSSGENSDFDFAEPEESTFDCDPLDSRIDNIRSENALIKINATPLTKKSKIIKKKRSCSIRELAKYQKNTRHICSSLLESKTLNPRIISKDYRQNSEDILIIDLEDDSCLHYSALDFSTSEKESNMEVMLIQKPVSVINLDDMELSDSCLDNILSENAESQIDSSRKKNQHKISKKRSLPTIDSNNNSSHYRKKRRLNCPRNPENEDYQFYNEKVLKKDVYYVKTVIKQPPGSYCYRNFFCSTCNVSTNSKRAFHSHMIGKKHIKVVKQDKSKNAIEDSINPVSVLSRYPQPSSNMCRKKSKNVAQLQRVIEKYVEYPCPGLEKVVEIQGLHETHYYCELCDSSCNRDCIVQHLTGFPHQVQCVKYFDKKTFESFLLMERREIKKKVIDVLKKLEKKYGCGKLTVEKEYLHKRRNVFKDQGNQKCYIKEVKQDCSRRDSEDKFVQNYTRSIIPDMSRSDFYCRICDAHMNNEVIWDSHIRGKRHISNCKRDPRKMPSKAKTILLPNARAFLMDELRYLEEPVVGLSHIRETQKPEVSGAMYNCFLCGACSGSQDDIISHIVSLKHRMKYLKNIKHPDMDLLQDMNIHSNHLYSIIEETCVRVMAERGRGIIEVHVTKKPQW